MSYLHEVRITPEAVVAQPPRSPKTYGQPLVRCEDSENDFGAIGEAVMTAKRKGSLRDFHVIQGEGEEILLQPVDKYADVNIGVLLAAIIYTHRVSRQPKIENNQQGFTKTYDILSYSKHVRTGAIQAQYQSEPRDIPTVPHQVRYLNSQRTPTYS